MPTLNVYELVAPLDARCKSERREAFARLVNLSLVSLLALAIILIGGGFTFTALQHILNPALAALSGVLLHGCIALSLYLYMEGRQNDNPAPRLFGILMYAAVTLVLLLIAGVRAARLCESHTLIAAGAIAFAVFALEMLLATGSALFLQMTVDAYKAAARRSKRTQELVKSLLAATDKPGWWSRYEDQLRQAVHVLEQQVFHAYDRRALLEARLEVARAERDWAELNSPLSIAHSIPVIVEPPRSFAPADHGANHNRAA